MKNGGGGAPKNKLLKGKFLGFTLELLRFKKPILPCHPEGGARSILKENPHEILRQEERQSLSCTNHAQNDMAFKIGTNPCHPEDEIRRIFKKNEQEILRFAQNDRKCAFTLAEVLITLGIIGIVAAMTLPTVINRAQEKELEARFRKAYNVLETATQKTIADLGYIPLCYNWPSGEKPYPPVECISKDENGNCIYGYPDGSPVPSDYGGPMSECKAFNAAFIKNLNVIQKCTHTEEDGCTVHYKGKDTILKEEDDSLTQEDLNSATSGDKNMRESVLNKLNSIVLADSLTIVAYDQTVPIIDINGKKGPNKWGYDLFRFKRVGSYKKGIYYEAYAGHPVEKGGRNCKQMLQSLFER